MMGTRARRAQREGGVWLDFMLSSVSGWVGEGELAVTAIHGAAKPRREFSFARMCRTVNQMARTTAMRSRGERVEWPGCSGQGEGLEVRQRRCGPLAGLRRASS